MSNAATDGELRALALWALACGSRPPVTLKDVLREQLPPHGPPGGRKAAIASMQAFTEQMAADAARYNATADEK